MNRIFPIDLDTTPITYHNYSNYLNWICYDAKTLQDYLDYFNPDYQVYNQTLYYISSNDWQLIPNDPKILPLGIITEESNEESTKIIYNLDLLKLKWREGVFNPLENSWIRLGTGKEYVFPENSIAFARTWTHSGNQDDENNPFFKDFNNYFIMSLPFSDLYTIRTGADAFQFDYVDNGQSVLGTNIVFSLEGGPNRYFIQDESKYQWPTSMAEWSVPNILISNNDIKGLVTTKQNQFWVNSFPLMHEVRINWGEGNENHSEEFIFDESFEVTNSRIANHSVVNYTIKVNNATPEEITNWSNVFVNII